MENIFPDALPGLDQLYRPGVAVDRHATYLPGVQPQCYGAGTDPELVLLDLYHHAGSGRHAGRPVQAPDHDRRRDLRLGLLSGDRRRLDRMAHAYPDALRAGGGGGSDLSGRWQAKRDVDDPER